MRNRTWKVSAIVWLTALWFGGAASGQTSYNLSLTATSVSASVNTGNLKYINDNRYASNSRYWSSYADESSLGQYAYVELGWASQFVVREVNAYWANDNDNVMLPADAYVAWWDGQEWQRDATLGEPDSRLLSTASVDFSTSNVRLYLRSDKACGIRELQFMGYQDPAVSYEWPAYSPTLNYDFRWEYPQLSAPTKGRLPERMNVARERHGEWWSVAVGPNANKAITDTAMVLLVKKMDEDFAFFRNEFGWPPDKRARNGYYSQVYGYGSGVGTDSEPNTATGGWQSATTWQGQSWPMVLLSYYPIASFDPA